MSNSKLAIIVPYRDRPQQLRKFIPHMRKYMEKFPWIDYEIIVVEQSDTKKFNRGKLLNIGFIHAEGRGHHYVIFHDVDLLPIDGTYEYSEVPLQLANQFELNNEFERTIQRDYFGGVTLFPIHTFREINGFSNNYRGWGFEDNDLLYRCRESNVSLKPILYKTPKLEKEALQFNGKNSHVKIQNKLSFARPITIVCSFYPDKIFCNPKEITDEYAIFGIPGYDLNISYNSFSTYKFELFLTNDETISVVSEHIPNLPIRAVVTIDPKEKNIEFYINGKQIFDKHNFKRDWHKAGIRSYKTEPYVYLGVADPNRKNKPKFFKGTIDSFCVYKKLLTQQEIREVSTNLNDELLTEGMQNYEKQDTFHMYFDSRHVDKTSNTMVDLSTNDVRAEVINCKFKTLQTDYRTSVDMPIRRNVMYKMLSHKEGGYIDGYWVDWSARVNQCYYHELSNNGRSNLENDGLTTCKHKLLKVDKYITHEIIKVRT